jgi:hypothetical protein
MSWILQSEIYIDIYIYMSFYSKKKDFETLVLVAVEWG